MESGGEGVEEAHGMGWGLEDAYSSRECSQRWPVSADQMVFELRAEEMITGL